MIPLLGSIIFALTARVETVPYFSHAGSISPPYSYQAVVTDPPISRVFYATTDLRLGGEIIPRDVYFQVFVTGQPREAYRLEFTAVPEPGSLLVIVVGVITSWITLKNHGLPS